MAWDDGLEGPALQFASSPSVLLRALAGPGTGKTTALLRRISRLLEQGVAQPQEIFVVTFTRTAAEDLKAALRHQLGDDVDVTARTLHAFCFSVLSRQGVFAITARVPRILLGFERDHLLRDLQGAFPGGITERRELTEAFESAWARQQVEHPGQPVNGLDQAFQDALLDSLRWHEGMLIGEVVPLALSYLRNNPQAPERNTYAAVLVDEYQDLNRAEQVVVDLLRNQGELTIIGDDDQSIYRFKWANPDGIRTFPGTHAGTTDVQFTQCRRCPRLVVQMAQTLIERNPGRVRDPLQPRPGNPDGELHHVQWTSLEAEANGIADFLQHQINDGVNPGKCLVLANSRRVGYGIRDAMQQRGIDTRSYFTEQALDYDEAQERLTLLTLLAKPDDRVALRCALAFGSTTRREGPYRRLLSEARQRGWSVYRVLEALESGQLNIPHSATILTRWQQLNAEINALVPIRDDLGALAAALFPAAVDGQEDPFSVLRPIAASAAAECESLEEFHTAIRYGLSQPEVPVETPFARVMSFHKSKGLTAEVVVLAGLIQGLIPNIDRRLPEAERTAALEEQRRLFFVGMTRTTRVLVFSSYSQLEFQLVMQMNVVPGPWIPGTASVRTLASSFLDEVGADLPNAIQGQHWAY